MQQVHAVPRSDKFKFHHHTLLPEVVLFFDLYFFTETKKTLHTQTHIFYDTVPSFRSFVRPSVYPSDLTHIIVAILRRVSYRYTIHIYSLAAAHNAYD